MGQTGGFAARSWLVRQVARYGTLPFDASNNLSNSILRRRNLGFTKTPRIAWRGSILLNQKEQQPVSM
jgi:hypothetical protein